MLAALIVAAAYLGPLVGGETFALRDQVTWALPARAFLHDALVAGRLPEWWDAVGLGVTFAGNPVNGVTYAPTWIVGLVPYAWGSDLLYVAHLVLLAVGVSRLARRLGADGSGAATAGVAAALSGFAASAVMNGIPLFALAWMPWILEAVDRRATLPLVALWAAQLTCRPARRRRHRRRGGAVDAGARAAAAAGAGWLAATFVAALPLAAVALLPSLALVGDSERRAGLSFAARRCGRCIRCGSRSSDGRGRSAAPRRTRAAARVSGRRGPSACISARRSSCSPAWRSRARGRRATRASAAYDRIAAIAALMLVVALGRYTPLYALYRAVVVPERLVRYPEKHLGAVVVLVAALAGVGFTHVFAAARTQRLARVAAAVVATLALAFVVGRAWGAALACAVVAAAIVVRRPSLAMAAVAAHLAIEGWIVQPLVPRAALTREPPLLAPIAAATPRPRVYRPAGLEPRSNATTGAEFSVAERDTGLPHAGSPFGLAQLPGFDAALDPRWHAVWDAGAKNGAALLRRFDVRWVILPAAAVARSPFVARAELGGLVLAENPQRRPRAFVAPRLDFSDGDTLTPCAIAAPRPEAIDLSCTAPAAGYAVLLDSFAAGWSATVDGTPAPIVRADEVVRAVAVPAGTHGVALRDRTPGLRAARSLALAWLACWPRSPSVRQRELLERLAARRRRRGTRRPRAAEHEHRAERRSRGTRPSADRVSMSAPKMAGAASRRRRCRRRRRRRWPSRESPAGTPRSPSDRRSTPPSTR